MFEQNLPRTHATIIYVPNAPARAAVVPPRRCAAQDGCGRWLPKGGRGGSQVEWSGRHGFWVKGRGFMRVHEGS